MKTTKAPATDANNNSPNQLSMDYIVPLARGGKSTKGNIVPSCVDCNRKKNLETPAEAALRKLSNPAL